MSTWQVVRWGLLALAAWLIFTNPAQAAHLVHNLGTLLTHIASSLSKFAASI